MSRRTETLKFEIGRFAAGTKIVIEEREGQPDVAWRESDHKLLFLWEAEAAVYGVSVFSRKGRSLLRKVIAAKDVHSFTQRGDLLAITNHATGVTTPLVDAIVAYRGQRGIVSVGEGLEPVRVPASEGLVASGNDAGAIAELLLEGWRPAIHYRAVPEVALLSFAMERGRSVLYVGLPTIIKDGRVLHLGVAL